MQISEWIQRGGPTIYPLIACSVISLAVIVERAVFFISQRLKEDKKLRELVLEHLEKSGVNDAREQGKKSNDYITRAIVSGISLSRLPIANALELAGKDEVKKMTRSLDILDTVIALAPILGILGTVLGIIQSFGILGDTQISDPRAATSGIAQALISTAAGLCIAIVNLIFFNYYNRKVSDKSSELEKHLTIVDGYFTPSQVRKDP